MKILIDKYIKYHALSWSYTTQKSERSRLLRLVPYLTGNPELLWNAIQDRGAYTRVTTWTRVTAFWDWLIQERHKNHNPYDKWRTKHANLFKNSYVKERLEITYEEAKARLNTISDPSIRRRAFEILGSAQRYSESDQEGEEITGKGSKPRPNLRPELSGPSFDKSYHTFYRALKKVGLKPHTLRKLALTRLVDKGATAYDLMEVAGWSSIQTASSYIQPRETNRLKELLHSD
jgi:integrase